MPIVLPSSEDAPLAQGDILQGIPLTATDSTLAPVAMTKANYVLVLSRNCGAIRAPWLTVAPIGHYDIEFPPTGGRATESQKSAGPVGLDKTRRHLAGVRDGGFFRYEFYLGPIDGKRHAANLETLFAIGVPVEPELRQSYVAKHRKWRLDPEFLADLHFRLYATYARLGFDDYRWFPDEDLRLLVKRGKEEIASFELAQYSAAADIEQAEASGQEVNKQRRASHRASVEKVREAKERLRPYLEELDRRGLEDE